MANRVKNEEMIKVFVERLKGLIERTGREQEAGAGERGAREEKHVSQGADRCEPDGC